MKSLLFLSTILVVANGQCDNSFKNYLNCIASTTGDASAGRNLELEFRDDFAKLVSRAFDPSVNPGNTKCALSQTELQTDIFGDSGPLRGCGECQKVAKDLRDKFFSASEQISACLRTKMAAAVIDELQPCIANQLGDQSFHIPDLPDFDLHTSGFKDLILQSTSYRVMAYSRLFVCRNNNAGRASTTERALQDKSGLFKQHCSLDESCTSKVQSNCQSQYNKVRGATCTCMSTKRNEWHGKFDKVNQAIVNFDSASTCSSQIKEAVGVWRYKLQNALKDCVPASDNILASIGIDKAIDQGCNDIAKFDTNQRSNLLTGIRMIRNLLDALNDRVTRFCDIKC